MLVPTTEQYRREEHDGRTGHRRHRGERHPGPFRRARRNILTGAFGAAGVAVDVFGVALACLDLLSAVERPAPSSTTTRTGWTVRGWSARLRRAPAGARVLRRHGQLRRRRVLQRHGLHGNFDGAKWPTAEPFHKAG